MNGFVNPYQRGFELPEGCKDLIDVMHMAAEPEHMAAQPNPEVLEGFADIEKYITRCAKSPYKRCGLTICCWQSGEEVLLSLIRLKGVLHSIIHVNPTHVFQRKIVRGLFAERGITPTQYPLAGDSSNQSRFLFYPLPTLTQDAAAIIIELLQKAYLLPQDARLVFELHESDGS